MFFSARNVLADEIHCQICDVYGPIAMSDSKVRDWVRQLKGGRVSVWTYFSLIDYKTSSQSLKDSLFSII